jgi:hypothetical protein
MNHQSGATMNQNQNQILPTQLDYILIDASSSMLDKWQSTIMSLNQYLEHLRRANLHSRIIVSTFSTFSSHSHANIECDQDLSTFEPLSIQCRGGMTPLYDAINTAARAIKDIDPQRATILIVTDGEENASKYTNETQARAMLNWLRAKGYQVIFMGCDFNNSAQARLLGASEDTAIGVQAALLTDAAKLLSSKRISYGLAGQDMHFSKSEQQQFGGLLPAPQSGI